MDESQTIRVSVEEAARLLGIEKGSVKKRIHRGKLRSEKDARGTTWVYVDQSETVRDESQGRSTTDSSELVDELRSHIADLRAQLEAERTSSAELRRIVAALTQRIPEIEPPSSQEPPGGPQSAAERGDREEQEPRPGGEGPQTGADRPRGTAEFPVRGTLTRPWWRRVFGG